MGKRAYVHSCTCACVHTRPSAPCEGHRRLRVTSDKSARSTTGAHGHTFISVSVALVLKPILCAPEVMTLYSSFVLENDRHT